jgi:negative regulator of flagellin synthesis FlgM
MLCSALKARCVHWAGVEAGTSSHCERTHLKFLGDGPLLPSNSYHEGNPVTIENGVKQVGPPSVGDNRTRPAKGPGLPGGVSPDSQVTVSSVASRLQQIEATLANVPIIDSARVEEIKNAISEGRFQVDAEKVADSLIASVRQMLAAQTPKA